MRELAWLAVIGGAVWLWVDSLRARERATVICNNTCNVHGLQLLDGTVALEGMALKRDRDGRIRIRRSYRFEFTRDGNERDGGTVVMLGQRMISMDLPYEGGRVLEHGEF